MEVELMAITPQAEEVIEKACRTCYLSFNRFDPPESTRELIRKVISKGHHSVLEHASATFRVKGGSRVFTHELVRHRFVSPSQESQRYVCYADKPGRHKTKDYNCIIPDSIDGVSLKMNGSCFSGREAFIKAQEQCYRLYEQLLAAGVPPEDARYILPGGTESEIVITANFRELRHLITLRCNPRAHWEIRRICLKILDIMKKEAPIVFSDFVIDAQGESAQLAPEEELG
ncbi:MAG: thymidylate synthase (FAD) [candidate division Zixibacteria bacterium CG_4_9_14_3_um_filter_46_8]|nr:MAG: thymidylate synthase (FAD) [candidate division Zixibacteria bacterium CG_4_9_14_3_um_filter_46_8]